MKHRTATLTLCVLVLGTLTAPGQPSSQRPVQVDPQTRQVAYPVDLWRSNAPAILSALSAAGLSTNAVAYNFYNTNLPAGMIVLSGTNVAVGTNVAAAPFYLFSNTSLPAGTLVTNGSNVMIGTNVPPALDTNNLAVGNLAAEGNVSADSVTSGSVNTDVVSTETVTATVSVTIGTGTNAVTFTASPSGVQADFTLLVSNVIASVVNTYSLQASNITLSGVSRTSWPSDSVGIPTEEGIGTNLTLKAAWWDTLPALTLVGDSSAQGDVFVVTNADQTVARLSYHGAMEVTRLSITQNPQTGDARLDFPSGAEIGTQADDFLIAHLGSSVYMSQDGDLNLSGIARTSVGNAIIRHLVVTNEVTGPFTESSTNRLYVDMSSVYGDATGYYQWDASLEMTAFSGGWKHESKDYFVVKISTGPSTTWALYDNNYTDYAYMDSGELYDYPWENSWATQLASVNVTETSTMRAVWDVSQGNVQWLDWPSEPILSLLVTNAVPGLQSTLTVRRAQGTAGGAVVIPNNLTWLSGSSTNAAGDGDEAVKFVFTILPYTEGDGDGHNLIAVKRFIEPIPE